MESAPGHAVLLHLVMALYPAAYQGQLADLEASMLAQAGEHQDLRAAAPTLPAGLGSGS